MRPRLSPGLTVTTAKQKQYNFRRQVLNLVLQSIEIDRVRHARVTNNRVRAEAEMTTGRNEAAAPISEAVAVAFNGNRWVRYQIIWSLQFGGAREVHIQR